MKSQLPDPDGHLGDQSEPHSTRRKSNFFVVAVLGSIVTAVAIWRSPPYSFHPMCTHSVNARVSAEVEIAGQKLMSSVVFQNSHSRGWISSLNSAGCKQAEGNALVFKTANNGLLIVPSRLCRKAELAFEQSGQVDILATCTQKQALQDSAFMVDSAARPSKWFAVTNGGMFRLINMTAVSTRSNPVDDIEVVAPNLLKSNFKYDQQQWSRSPEKIISFQRRYDLMKHTPDQAFAFEVRNERFDVK